MIHSLVCESLSIPTTTPTRTVLGHWQYLFGAGPRTSWESSFGSTTALAPTRPFNVVGWKDHAYIISFVDSRLSLIEKLVSQFSSLGCASRPLAAAPVTSTTKNMEPKWRRGLQRGRGLPHKREFVSRFLRASHILYTYLPQSATRCAK